MGKIGLENQFVKLSDRRLLPAIFRGMGFSDDQARRAMVSVDKLDKLPVENVLEESAGYLSAEENGEFERFLRDITGDADLPLEVDALGSWGRRCQDEVEPILANLRGIRDVVNQVRPGAIRLRFWPGLARGMAYYTGPIFEIWDGQNPFSLAGGGRYDNLIGKFLGQAVPACGFSIGFERILTVMKKRRDRPTAAHEGPSAHRPGRPIARRRRTADCPATARRRHRHRGPPVHRQDRQAIQTRRGPVHPLDRGAPRTGSRRPGLRTDPDVRPKPPAGPLAGDPRAAPAAAGRVNRTWLRMAQFTLKTGNLVAVSAPAAPSREGGRPFHCSAVNTCRTGTALRENPVVRS